MITATECLSYNSFHDRSSPFLIKGSKGVVVKTPINELNIHGNMTRSYQLVVVQNPANSTITIHKRVDVFKS